MKPTSSELTKREVELIDSCVTIIKASGRAPSYSLVARTMGITRQRAKAIVESACARIKDLGAGVSDERRDALNETVKQNARSKA
jgi:hypothetical protein